MCNSMKWKIDLIVWPTSSSCGPWRDERYKSWAWWISLVSDAYPTSLYAFFILNTHHFCCLVKILFAEGEGGRGSSNCSQLLRRRRPWSHDETGDNFFKIRKFVESPCAIQTCYLRVLDLNWWRVVFEHAIWRLAFFVAILPVHSALSAFAQERYCMACIEDQSFLKSLLCNKRKQCWCCSVLTASQGDREIQ